MQFTGRGNVLLKEDCLRYARNNQCHGIHYLAFMKSSAINQCIQHIGFIRRYVIRRVPVPEAVEDIVQQVITDFLSKIDQFELRDDIRPLLIGIAQKCVATYWREHSKRSPDTLTAIARHLQSLMSQDELLPQEHDAQMALLKSCLDLLPTHGRSLIDMYYFEEQSSSHIAETLHKKKDTIVRAIHRLREKLRQCMEAKYRREAHN